MTNSEHVKPIRVSTLADRDLAGIGRHTEERWGEAQKKKYLEKMWEKFRQLRDMPGLGVKRSEYGRGRRAYPIGSHIVFYRETEDQFRIVRILHQCMDPEMHLGQGDDAS